MCLKSKSSAGSTEAVELIDKSLKAQKEKSS